jgi:WD40 repeat protein
VSTRALCVVPSEGSRIVTTSWDNTARIWDAMTGTVINVLRGHEGLVWSAAFSPDGFPHRHGLV